MQSLKSTAFAVTLLAISFGLYCVSSNNTPPEAELIDPIQIDSSFSTTSQSGSMTMPSHNINSQPAPMQVSTNTAPSLEKLPSSRVGNLLPTGDQISFNPNTAPPVLNQNTPLKLPSLSQPPAQPTLPATTNQTVPELPSFSQSGFQKQPAQTQPEPIQLQLPEIAARQPVSISPTVRDNGLINALESNDFNPQNGNASNDNSFNAQATAVTNTEDDDAVKSAEGSFASLSVPNLKNEAPAKPAPVSIADVWEEVDQLVAADEYRRALGTLSQHYGKKGLTGPQKQKLQGWLDALAGKVIYSTEHLFVKQPHIVQMGETLASISQRFKVPGEVIYNINQSQFNGANEVSPGMQLKMVQGPFHAEVDLEKKMLTLFVQNLYAGRFPVAIGISGNPGEGNYDVKVKSPSGFTWRDAKGKEYPAGSPGNGYGPYWMGLSGSLCVHAVPSGTPQGHRGCIGLSEKDAKDVYSILSKDSQISIVR